MCIRDRVKDVMGLIQEACLSSVIKPCIWQGLQPGQSGFSKGRNPYDPHLVLFELTRMSLDTSRCLWIVMGDYEKAFPRVWRSDLLDMMSNVPAIRGGCALLFEECLKEDRVIISLSGCLLYTSPSPRDGLLSRMPSSA